MIRYCIEILSNVVVNPNGCLLLLLIASALLLYISERHRKSEAASVRELEALFALRDQRDRAVRRERR